jgi:hypothetical protein
MLNRISVATDGNNSGAFETLLRNGAGETTSIFVNNTTPNAMTLTDMDGRSGVVDLAQSNYLSNRVTIHLVNNYMKYRY